MKTTKAIVKLTNAPNGLSLVDVPFPTINHNQVLIKVRKTAICGTDLHIYNWDSWAQKTISTPQIIGHEFVGEVVETGMYVTNVKIGQLVTGEGHIVCGKCRHCITGYPHLCRQTIGIGVNLDGVFSQYISFPASNLWVCEPGISVDIHSI
jgi:threonine 3-dehydrogenase